MSTTNHSEHENDGGWDHIGQAAEDFAYRVARDATKFAERMSEHAGEFARDVSRDWRRTRREHRRGWRHGCRHQAPPDVRRIFEDVRTVLGDVLDGMNEFIDRVFVDPKDRPSAARPPEGTDETWVRMVNNRDVTCGQCDRPLAAGDEGFARRTDAGMEFRCLECGVPSASPTQ